MNKQFDKSSRDRKRDAPSTSTSSSLPKKKSRSELESRPGSASSSSSSSKTSSASSSADTETKVSSDKSGNGNWNIINITQKALESGNVTSAESHILEQIKKFKKDKFDLKSHENFLIAAKSYPACFRTNAVVDTIVDSIKSSNNVNVDAKFKTQLGSPMLNSLSIFLINVLTHAFGDLEAWPHIFLELWMEDASGNRQWVDKPLCSSFVENVIASFGTKSPQPHLQLNEPLPAPSNLVKDSDVEELTRLLEAHPYTKPPEPRFVDMEGTIESIVVNPARLIIQKKAPEVPKNLIKALCSACGLFGVRAFLVSRIEQWIHNPKCTRHAQQLLLYICVNANSNTTLDADIVVAISKLKIKTKTLNQFYLTAIREMVRENEHNMRNILNQVVYNELSLARNPNNFPIMGVVVPSSPAAFAYLATIVMDLFQKKEDFLMSIRLMLREIVKAAKNDGCNLPMFVEGLLQSKEILWTNDLRERTFKSVTELILLCMFLSLTPTVKEATFRSDDRDLSVMATFHQTLSKMQEDALRWLYLVAPKMYLPSKKDFIVAMNKILLQDPITDVQSKDNWPPENEKSIFAKVSLQTPLSENSLIWILFQGIPKEHSLLNLNEILDFAEHVVLKAATHNCLLPLQKLEIIELLFRLTQYKHPDNIILPAGYEPPKLAISKSYWRACILLCVIASYNPATLGKVCWDSYPTIKALMEMCMTNHFVYPTPSSSLTVEETMANERQIAGLEKERILEFEGHLAAASSKTITEKTSLLLSQVITLDPLGVCRFPPQTILTHLQTLNERLRLGHYLCKSRNPDFLVNLIQTQTKNAEPTSKPWLSELISEGSFETLPVQCLAEYLLGQTHRLRKSMLADKVACDSSEKTGRKVTKVSETLKDDVKGMQLVHFLKDVLNGKSDDASREVLEYFLRRLCSVKTQCRIQALYALQLLFSANKILADETWLMECVPHLNIFPDMQEMITSILRQAIQVETDPVWIARYIEFLSTWGFIHKDSEMDSIALDVAQLVVERNSIISSLLSSQYKMFDPLFDIFLSFIKKVREPHKESYKWCDGQDQVLLKWDVDKLEATANILIIHATVILLSSYCSYSSKNEGEGNKELAAAETKFKELLEIWFPRNKDNNPKGFLLNTSEEADLYPDWIKLRMIRSDNARLITAALMDIDVDQLILFVQSFGIPVKAMTALLYCMDSAVDKDPAKVTAAIADAHYMSTLVEMQWSRGASGANRFFNLLKSLTGGLKDEGGETQIELSSPTRPYLKKRSIKKISACKSELKGFYCNYVAEKRNSEVKGETERPADIRELTDKLVEVSNNSSSSNSIGQLVDTIIEVEPCTIRNAIDVQLPLLFGRNKSALPFRSLLLTMLIHESSWSTVGKCIETFLSAFNSNYDPSAVLDLIASSIANPKLWQGCDKYVPKHQPYSSVFHLTNEQLLVMAEYIMEEIRLAEMKSTKFSISHLLSSSDEASAGSESGRRQKHYVQDRVKLWVQCCVWNKVTVEDAMEVLIRNSSKDSSLTKFLSQVYLEFPEIIKKIDISEQSEIVPDDQVTSVLDNITHSLIYTVSNVQQGKDWYKRITGEVEQCLRKIAATHPNLILRQLNLINTLLEGRTHLEYNVFHAQNQHVPFQVFLGLLELMHNFILKQVTTVQAILIHYIKLFTRYGHLKDYSITLGRFAILIQNLLRANPSVVRELLSSNYEALKKLSRVKYYEELQPLQNLMNSLVPPSSGSELTFLTSENTEVLMNTSITLEMLNRIKNARKDDELVPILQELESLCNRNPSLLNQFPDVLIPLLRSESDICRNLAFNLVLKHMTHSPDTSHLYLESVLKTLQARDSLNNSHLTKRFNEFILLSQEHGDGLLRELFQIGINSNNIDVLPAIKKAISFLRIQKSQS